MTEGKISLGQLMTVFTLAVFALGTEMLPARLAGAGSAAWLCPLAAGAVAVLLAALVGRRPILGQGDLTRTMEKKVGKYPARVLLLLFLAWGLFLTSAQAARIGSRLSDSLRASPALVTAAVLVLLGWVVAGGLPAFSRACEIFALAVGFGFFLIFLFGVFRLRWDLVLLWRPEELKQVPLGAFTAAGTVAAGSYALFLTGDVVPVDHARRRFLLRLSGLFLVLTAAVLLVVGRLGPALMGQIGRPFFQMVSGLGFEGAFQRLEELASALWLFGDLALLGLLFLCLRRLFARLLGREEKKGHGWFLVAVVFLASLKVSFWKNILAGTILPVGNLTVCLALVILLGLRAQKNEKN